MDKSISFAALVVLAIAAAVEGRNRRLPLWLRPAPAAAVLLRLPRMAWPAWKPPKPPIRPGMASMGGIRWYVRHVRHGWCSPLLPPPPGCPAARHSAHRRSPQKSRSWPAFSFCPFSPRSCSPGRVSTGLPSDHLLPRETKPKIAGCSTARRNRQRIGLKANWYRSRSPPVRILVFPWVADPGRNSQPGPTPGPARPAPDGCFAAPIGPATMLQARGYRFPASNPPLPRFPRWPRGPGCPRQRKTTRRITGIRPGRRASWLHSEDQSHNRQPSGTGGCGR